MQPEIPSPQDTHPEPLPVVEETASEPIPVQELVKVEPAPIQKQERPKRNVATMVLGVFTLILLVAAIGLGAWGYTLKTKLTATQQQLTRLQSDHSKLQTDFSTLTGEKEKLAADLTQIKADLDKTTTDLATSQADLKKAKDENKSLKAQISQSGKYADVLYSWFTSSNPSDVFRINSQIQATKNSKLAKLWNDLVTSPSLSEDKFGEFMVYLVTALRDELK